jgi:hypothetical protein
MVKSLESLSYIDLSQSEYSEDEEDEDTPDDETPCDTLPCRIYAYVNSPEPPNLSISSNGSRIEKQEKFFFNTYLPILVLVLHMKKHLKDGWRPHCMGQIYYSKVP